MAGSDGPPDGFVLAGGASARMGADKAWVLWDGEPMALVVARALGAVCGRVALVRRGPDVEPWPLPVVHDRAHDGTHPLYGLAAALEAATTELVLVAPCDVPALDPASLVALLEVGGPAVASDGVRRHPLIGVFPRSWSSRAREGAEAGISAQRFSRPCVEVVLPAERLANCNRPGDVARGSVDLADGVRYARPPVEE